MRKLILLITTLFALSFNLIACGEGDNDPRAEIPSNNEDNNSETENKNMKLQVTIGESVLTAILENNPTASDFISLLPLTVKLDDYASSEKIFYNYLRNDAYVK